MSNNQWFTIKEDEIINKKYIVAIKLVIDDKSSEHYGDRLYTMYGYILITTNMGREYKLNVLMEHYTPLASPNASIWRAQGYLYRSDVEKKLREKLLPIFKKCKEEICEYMGEGE